VAAIGRVLIGLGALILLFVAYQLWGTGLSASHSQDVLRHQLAAKLRATPSVTAPATGSTAATTTSPPVAAGPAPTVSPPSEGDPVGIMVIPKIGLNKAIVEGTGTADLREGPGHYSGTPLPGESGNAAIAGHRTTYGAPFYRLNELGSGDQITVTTPQGNFRYVVNRSTEVDPSDVSVIDPTTTNELTLTTCTPRFSAARRLIVQAALVSAPAPAAPAVPRAQKPSPNLAGQTGAGAPVLGWGLGVLAVLLGLWLVARTRRRRWPIYLLGTAPILVVLFMFFVAVSKVLPASI
jgi:sortase A